MKKNHSIQLSLRKLVLSAMVAAPLATLPTPLWALPSYTSSSSSSTSTTTVGSTLSINTPDRSVLKWASYGVGASEAVIYNLPSTSSSVLNIVTAGGGTNIAGTVTSNGKILILDTAGITVSGNITAAGLTLSTKPETEFYYLTNGDLGLTAAASGDISISGNITVGKSGTATFAGSAVTIGQSAGNMTIDAGTTNVWSSGVTKIGSAAKFVTFGSTADKYGTLNVNTNGGTLNIADYGADVTVAGGSASLVSGNAVIKEGVTSGTGKLIIGTGDASGTLTTSSGTADATYATLAGAGKTLNVVVTDGANVSVTTAADGLTIGGTTSGSLTAVTTSGDLTLNASTIGNGLTATAGVGDLKSGGTVKLKAGTISLTASTGGKKITYVGTGDLSFGTITSNGSGAVNLTTDGNITLPAISTQDLTVSAAKISEGAVTVAATGTATLTSSDKIDLTAGTNQLATIVAKNAPNGASINNTVNTTIGSGTSVTGDFALTTTGKTVAFGGSSGDTISLAKATIDTTSGAATGADVTQTSDNTTITGKLTVTSGTAGNIVLDGSTGKGTGLKNQYAQVNLNGAAVTIFEQSALDLGTVTATGNLIAYSATSIANSGVVKAPTAYIGAGTTAAPGAIVLDYNDSSAGTNQLGTVNIIDDLDLLNGSITTGTVIGNALASNITLVNGTALTFNLLPSGNVYGTTASIPVALTTTGTANLTANNLATTGAVSLTSNTGDISATGGSFSAATVKTAGGAVDVRASGDLLVNATLGNHSVAHVTTKTVNLQSTGGNLTIGSVDSWYDTNPVQFKAAKSVTDSAPGIAIYGPVSFTADGGGSVNVTNIGHNFGAIEASSKNTGGTTDGNVAIVEGGTMIIGTNGVVAGNGTVSLTSTSGEVKASKISTSGAVSLTATAGNVSLTNGANTASGAISVTSGGSAAVISQDAALKVGTVVVSAGTLSLTSANGNVTQTGAINAYGNTTVSAKTDIKLDNTGNRFGALDLTTTNGSDKVTVVEDTTVNLKKIASTTGDISVTSVNGDIIDSGGIISAGTATFTANNGSITLDNSASKYVTVSLNTNNNATIVQPSGAGADITLAKSNVGGALTVTNQGANTVGIKQSGALSVGGNATFNSNGYITLDNTANTFGPVRFTAGGATASTFTEASSFNLNAGSIATDAVTINTNGDFLTSGTGGSSFTNNLTINAIGTIKPAAGSLLVTGTLTVFSNNTKDLSGLSKSGNLAGNAPVNQGTGTYVPPSE